MQNIELEELNIASIEDLLDKEYIRKFCLDFSKSTGIEVALVGVRNPMEFLEYPSRFEFCKELQKKSSFADKCAEGTKIAMEKLLKENDQMVIVPCHIGLIKFGFWITIMGKKLGILAGCKIAINKKCISKKRCYEICKEYENKKNKKKLFKSFKTYPIFSERELDKTLEFFRVMAKNLEEIVKTKYQLKLEDSKKSNLAKYFSPMAFSKIENKRKNIEIKYTATILFCDIRNFVSQSEKLELEELVRFLNEYYEIMVEIIFKYNGSIDKFIGDAILAVFGTPEDNNGCVFDAIKAAKEMTDAIRILNGKRMEKGNVPIDIGIGIHVGEIIAANIGSSRQQQYTVVGDTVNIASRLEALTKNYSEKIIISETLYSEVKDFICQYKEEYVMLKGKSDYTKIYRVNKISL